MTRILSFIIIYIFLFTLPGFVSAKDENLSGMEPLYFYLFSQKVSRGNTNIVNIECMNAEELLSTLTVRFKERDIPLSLYPLKSEKKIIGLIAIPLDTDPGPTYVAVDWVRGGEKYSVLIPFTIVTREFPSTRINVNPAYTVLSEENKKRIASEFEEVTAIVSGSTSSRLWQNPWKMPVKNTPTSAFGTMRIFNSKVVSIHKGVDLGASTGTPVLAANDGIVRLAKEIFYAGNCVIIDHGMNILTTYAHLSRIHVINGQEVTAGQIIGLAGSTGRANGPHLHWGVRIGGVTVSPLQFYQAAKYLSKTE